MDAKKLKWWENKAETSGGSQKEKEEEELAASKDGIAASTMAGGGAAATAGAADHRPVTVPGAVAVRGPEYQGSGFDDTSTVPGRRGGGGRADGGRSGDVEPDEAPPLQVDSYVVREQLTDEEIRQRILAGTAHAEVMEKIELNESTPRRRYNRNAVLGLLALVAVGAIAVGVAIPLSRKPSSGAGTQQRDENVVASLEYLEFQAGVVAQTREFSGSQITTGEFQQIHCRPKICLESNVNCVTGDNRFYVPGCCAGPDCPNETKCGEFCPLYPEACIETDPANKTCLRAACYTCAQENGEDLYVLRDYALSVDCLQVGTAIRPRNGLIYKWAIYCGPVTAGPIVEENRDLGEYQCQAMRLGANFSDEAGGLLSIGYPCQYIALAECGCGPSDMYTFGLPEPTGPCQPDNGCPFLCEGVGSSNEYTRNLCRSFPGNISWWEGGNVFGRDFFIENAMTDEYQLEIYIKGVDS